MQNLSPQEINRHRQSRRRQQLFMNRLQNFLKKERFPAIARDKPEKSIPVRCVFFTFERQPWT
ncbi:MAG UNVERIFIED_CONTAM: hypothetical protein LVR18_34850 [Planctomycetaceae bacterium]